MPGYSIASHIQRIDAAFARAAAVEDLETKADMARYLCVLMSGLLEQAVRHSYSSYAAAKSHANISRYVERDLELFQNAKPAKLFELAGRFSAAWRADLEAFLVDRVHDHVSSVVANKNLIAHGESVGVTYVRALEFYASVKEVVAFVERQCAP
jgi:hypothetical protein